MRFEIVNTDEDCADKLKLRQRIGAFGDALWEGSTNGETWIRLACITTKGVLLRSDNSILSPLGVSK